MFSCPKHGNIIKKQPLTLVIAACELKFNKLSSISSIQRDESVTKIVPVRFIRIIWLLLKYHNSKPLKNSENYHIESIVYLYTAQALKNSHLLTLSF